MTAAAALPLLDRFSLASKNVLITGAGGLLGVEHARAVLEAGGTALVSDLDLDRMTALARELDPAGKHAIPVRLDVTNRESCQLALAQAVHRAGKVDVVVNNAARNPKVETGLGPSRFENFSLDDWEADLAVGLRGAFLVSQAFGAHMASTGGGVIVNIASDLGLIAPDQRIYREPGQSRQEASTKPVTYSVVKGGLILMTRYLATYWAEDGVRVNALAPGGVSAGQSEPFVERLTNLIPMGRMASRDEYRAALVFLASEASSYMTGATLVIDGGRTCW